MTRPQPKGRAALEGIRKTDGGKLKAVEGAVDWGVVVCDFLEAEGVQVGRRPVHALPLARTNPVVVTHCTIDTLRLALARSPVGNQVFMLRREPPPVLFHAPCPQLVTQSNSST